MTSGEFDRAARRALNLFDEWNAVTGFMKDGTGYFYELQSLIIDAVHCGAQQATGDFKPLSDGEKEQPWRVGKPQEKGEA